MDLGVGLPSGGPLASPANIVRLAQEAERLGYGAVWTFERLLRPVADVPQPGGPPRPLPTYYHTVYEPLETLSYVAAQTSRIRLGTSVIDALFQPPVLLARRLATLDQFSEGRVIAGLGQGWMPQEFETANIPMRRIGAGLDEVVAALRACWGADPVAYEGRFYRIAPSEVNPKPVQPHLPVLIGAMTPAGVQRAARIGDGINPIAFTEKQVLGLIETFRAAVGELGRDPATATIAVRANVPLTSAPMGDDRPYLGGAPDQVAADLAGLRGAGIDHVLFANVGPAGLDEQVDVLGRLQEAAAKG